MRFNRFCASLASTLSVLALLAIVFGSVGCGSGGGSTLASTVDIDVEFVSGTTSQLFMAEAPGEGDVVEFTIAYLVTAIGGDVYVDHTCAIGGDALSPEDGNVMEIGEEVGGNSDISAVLTSTAEHIFGSSFRVEAGATEEFKLTVIIDTRTDGFAQLVLEGVGWSAFPGEGDQMLELPVGEYETTLVFLNYIEEGSSQRSDGADDGYGDYDDGGYSDDGYTVPVPRLK